MPVNVEVPGKQGGAEVRMESSCSLTELAQAGQIGTLSPYAGQQNPGKRHRAEKWTYCKSALCSASGCALVQAGSSPRYLIMSVKWEVALAPRC